MTWIARTVPFTSGFHATSVPLATLNAATWLRVTSCEPAGAPGGRTAVNCPPMYTRFLLTTITLTRPFVCHVGVGVVDTTANAGVPITSPHAPNTTAIAAARNTRARISPPDGRFESPVQGTAGTGQVKTPRIRAHEPPNSRARRGGFRTRKAAGIDCQPDASTGPPDIAIVAAGGTPGVRPRALRAQVDLFSEA